MVECNLKMFSHNHNLPQNNYSKIPFTVDFFTIMWYN